MNKSLSPKLTAMAEDLALGLLAGQERAMALRHSLANPDFAALVREWQDRLEPLALGFAAVQPPNLWPAIEAQIDVLQKRKHGRSARFWRYVAIPVGALAASLAAVLVLSPTTIRQTEAPPPATAAIAQLEGAGGTLLSANLDRQTRLLSIRADALPDSELVPELWLIPGDGVPRSLGLIASEGTTRLVLPTVLAPLMVDGAVLAVSLETPEGAPHAAPSSTPIATGTLTTI